MIRREFLRFGVGAAAATIAGWQRSNAADGRSARLALGFDNFSIRGFGWKADQLLEYAAGQNCDCILFSDLDVYDDHSAAALHAVRAKAADLGIKVYAGTGGICPTSSAFNAKWGNAEEHLRLALTVAAALESPVLRCYLGNGSDRASEGGIRARIADTVAELRKVRSQAMDAGIRIAVENHAGDMQAHELRDLIEAAGPDFVGATIDAGNATWTLEDPLVNLEILAPYAACTGIRDSMVWETEDGAKAQWTAIGEGNVDMAGYFRMFAELCPDVPVILEIISEYGKDLRYRKPEFWNEFREARAWEFQRYQDLARSGKPVEGFRPPQDGNRDAAVRAFQKAELERSLTVCRERFGLGRRA